MRILPATLKLLQEFYGLDRPVTEPEALVEIANLQLRAKAGTLDDRQELLAARLALSGGIWVYGGSLDIRD